MEGSSAGLERGWQVRRLSARGQCILRGCLHPCLKAPDLAPPPLQEVSRGATLLLCP